MMQTAAGSLMLNLYGDLNANKAKLKSDIISQHIPAVKLLIKIMCKKKNMFESV